MIDIKGLDKGKLLAALYNRARVQGMGYLQAKPGDMTPEEAYQIIEGRGDDITAMFGKHHTTYFDYLYGRVMKVEIGGDVLDPRYYDRDNGEGAAWSVIEPLRAKGAAQ